MSASLCLVLTPLVTAIIAGHVDGARNGYYMLPFESYQEDSVYLAENNDVSQPSTRRTKPLYIEIPNNVRHRRVNKARGRRNPKSGQRQPHRRRGARNPKSGQRQPHRQRVYRIKIVPQNNMLKGVQMSYPSGDEVVYIPRRHRRPSERPKPIWIKVKAYDPRFGVRKRSFPLRIDVKESRRGQQLQIEDIFQKRRTSVAGRIRTKLTTSRATQNATLPGLSVTLATRLQSGKQRLIPTVSSSSSSTTASTIAHRKLFQIFDNIYNDTKSMLTHVGERPQKEQQVKSLGHPVDLGRSGREFVWMRYRPEE